MKKRKQKSSVHEFNKIVASIFTITIYYTTHFCIATIYK